MTVRSRARSPGTAAVDAARAAVSLKMDAALDERPKKKIQSRMNLSSMLGITERIGRASVC